MIKLAYRCACGQLHAYAHEAAACARQHSKKRRHTIPVEAYRCDECGKGYRYPKYRCVCRQGVRL